MRRTTAALLAGVLAAPLLAAPVSAAGLGDAAVDEVEAVAPAAAGAGHPGDGLAEVAVRLPLTGAPDDAPAGSAGTAALPSHPNMVILEDVPTGTVLALRSRNSGTWSPWITVEAEGDDAPDGERDPLPGVGPVWIGDGATHIEVALVEGDVSAVDIVGLHPVAEAAQGVRGLSGPRASVAASGSPFIRARSAWATSEMGWKCNTGPEESTDLRAMVVHHTASGTRAYAQDEVPGLIRAFWRYHVVSRGWCDIAYNFLVDRFGGVWEGRQGGIRKAIVGGHTYGFNSQTTSIAQIGDFDAAATPTAVTRSTARLTGWKLGLHRIDPSARTTLTNRTGSTFEGVAPGGQVPVRTVSGHRDLGSTACPGRNSYATLPTVRDNARTGAHLVSIHRKLVGALPSPDAYRYWMDVTASKGLRTSATAIARSRAYSGRYIEDLYRRVLDRAPDNEGMAYWLNQMAHGMRAEDVGALFYGSEEYVRDAGSLEHYVELLYENLLHRSADREGRDYWTGLLRSGEASPAEVARGFYASIESRRDRVTRLYVDLLGREPDRAGREHWAEELLDVDDIVLAVELVLSTEFFQRSMA